MSATLELQECHQDTDDESDLIHVVCECNDNVAFCGEDMSEVDYVDDTGDTPRDCIVCVHLEVMPCERCGKTLQ